MKVYVGTYAKYNNGSLEGNWLELDDYSDKMEFLDACAELHKDEIDAEFMFQDYDSDNELDSFYYHESWIDEKYWKYKKIFENCSFPSEVILEYKDKKETVIEAIERAENSFCGSYESDYDYVEDVIDNLMEFKELPSLIRDNLDYDAILHELSHNEEYIYDNDKRLYVFGC